MPSYCEVNLFPVRRAGRAPNGRLSTDWKNVPNHFQAVRFFLTIKTVIDSTGIANGATDASGSGTIRDQTSGTTGALDQQPFTQPNRSR
jgi:hypothetical protein